MEKNIGKGMTEQCRKQHGTSNCASVRAHANAKEPNRWFVFEHPAYADTWRLPCMKRLLETPGVDWRIADQCQYGLVTPDHSGQQTPALKPTKFVSNGWCLLEELSRRCPGDHKHQGLIGGRASAAAEYPTGLCNALCKGLVRQKKYAREQCVDMKCLGKAELKSLIKKIVITGTEASKNQRVETQCDTRNMNNQINSIVTGDCQVARDVAEKHRRKRQEKSALRRAQEQPGNEAGQSCIRSSTCAGSNKKVKFSVDSESVAAPGVRMVDMIQAHWHDKFHEPDGTHPSLLVGAGLDSEKTETEARNSDLFGPHAYFHRGENVGEMLLQEHLRALTTRDGVTTYVDDV